MLVARQDIRVPRGLVQIPIGLVEAHAGKGARVDAREELLGVLQMTFAIRGARGEPRKVVERMVMRLEVDRSFAVRIDDVSSHRGGLHAVRQRTVRGARVPGPRDALRGKRVADGPHRLWWERMFGQVGEARIAASSWCVPRRLIWRLRRVDDIAVRSDIAVEELGRTAEC